MLLISHWFLVGKYGIGKWYLHYYPDYRKYRNYREGPRKQFSNKTDLFITTKFTNILVMRDCVWYQQLPMTIHCPQPPPMYPVLDSCMF